MLRSRFRHGRGRPKVVRECGSVVVSISGDVGKQELEILADLFRSFLPPAAIE